MLMNIRNNEIDFNDVIVNVFDIADFNEIGICECIEKILNSDESIECEELLILVRHRNKLGLQKLTSYNMFYKLFKSNDINIELYLLIVCYFYGSFSEFAFSTSQKYKNKLNVFNDKLSISENDRQYKYRLCNEFSKSHYLSEYY